MFQGAGNGLVLFLAFYASSLCDPCAALLRTSGEDGKDAWASTTAWMIANGAIVHPGLRSNMTSHGGAHIRGVITDSKLVGGEALLQVPRKLWIVIDNFPEVEKANVTKLQCANMKPSDLETMKAEVALALETRKGNASFYYPYIRSLPTLGDFKSFHPRWVTTALAVEFGTLPIVKYGKMQQLFDTHVKACFQSWQRNPGDLNGLVQLSWQDMELAISQFRTRTYGVANGVSALIPGSDLLNTGSGPELNTNYAPAQDTFTLRAAKSVLPGSELYDPYCPNCENGNMMANWGVFLENNPTQLRWKDYVRCSTAYDEGRALRKAAESALDVNLKLMASEGWNSPRCRTATTADQPQGPLRCSLARMAWEFCGNQWVDKQVTSLVRSPSALEMVLAQHSHTAVTSTQHVYLRRKSVAK